MVAKGAMEKGWGDCGDCHAADYGGGAVRLSPGSHAIICGC